MSVHFLSRDLVLGLSAAILVSACAAEGDISVLADTAGTDAGPEASGADVAPDPGAAETAAPVDALDAAEDVSTLDLPEELPPAPDVAEEFLDPCTQAPYGFGCACQQDSDCESLMCVQAWSGKVCTSACQEECPDGFACSLVVGSCPDCSYQCMPLFVNLCRPCITNSDCMGGDTASGDLCVELGPDGSFCGAACSGVVTCPDGYSCKSVTVVGGIKSYQCVPDGGQCECSELAIAQAAGTTCKVSNAFGTCSGTRQCTDAGLSDCEAQVPAAEVCNATDDNCNGAVDEDILAAACTVKNDFGECPGSELCIGGSTICDAADPAPEVCDGLDNDCDGLVDEVSLDSDGDGLANCVDEDDDNDTVFDELDNCPLAYNKGQEDNDFDMAGDACDPDDDNDQSPDTLDCMPFDKKSYPGADEVCDGVDNDCDKWVDEATCDDGNWCTTDVCDPVAGCANDPNSNPCDDGNPCTAGDTCEAGQCASGPNLCECVTDADCAQYEDGNLCNGTLACDKAGTFSFCKPKPGTAVQCPASDNPCSKLECVPATGQCAAAALPDGTPCTDADKCTLAETCQKGVCTGGVEVTCNDSNVCTSDFCDPDLGCVYNAMTGTPCNDGDFCTTGDACKQGVCGGGKPLACSDGNPCTKDLCVPATGCSYEPQAAACDDGNQCTTQDTCQLGICTGAASLPCDDGNACTLDSCAPKTGCVHTATKAPCSDDNACTLVDQCVGTQCVGTVAPDCDDDNLCTDDSCAADKGCVHTLNTAACDDLDACTTADACSLGACKGGPALSCDDGNKCTTDTCEPATGCKHVLSTDYDTDEQNCGGCGVICPQFTVCQGGKCLLLAGQACAGGGDCMSGYCRDDWDGTGKFCAQDAVSCVYALAGNSASQVTPGGKMCGGSSAYKACSAGQWTAPSTCLTASCNGQILSKTQACVDGTGCTPPVQETQDCTPYACQVAGCKSSCANNQDCAGGHICSNNVCSAGPINQPGSILQASTYYGESLAGWVQCAGWTNTSNWDILATNWIHSCARNSGQMRFRLHNASGQVVFDETYPNWTSTEMTNNLPGCDNNGYGTCGKGGASGKYLLIFKPNNDNGGCHGDDNSSGAVRIANSINGDSAMGHNYLFLGGKRQDGNTRSHNQGSTPTSEIRWLGGSMWDGCQHDGRADGYSIAVYVSQ